MLTMSREGTTNHIRSLMSIAATLAECTIQPEHCSEIPLFLGRALGFESLTLAVIRKAKDDADQHVLFGHSCGPITSSEGIQSFSNKLLTFNSQIGQRVEEDGAEFREEGLDEAMLPYTEITVQDFAAFPRALIFDQSIDATHRMLLIIHQRRNDAPLNDGIVEDILLIREELAKQLHSVVVAKDSPETLGKPFDRLTNQEWVVLRGLNSDASEKQLASEAGISPHTLHSHIKSIYRKFGVQGRLTLLLRLNSAIHRMRMENRSS